MNPASSASWIAPNAVSFRDLSNHVSFLLFLRYKSIVRFALFTESGAEVDANNANGEVPLHDAVKRGDIEIIKELLRNGADANAQPFKGYIMFFTSL